MKPKYLTDPLLIKVKFDINAKYSEYFDGSTLNYDGLIKDIRSIRIAINNNNLYYGEVSPAYWGANYKGLMSTPNKDLSKFLTKYYKDLGEQELMNLFSPTSKNKPNKLNIISDKEKEPSNKVRNVKGGISHSNDPIKRFKLEDFLDNRIVEK